MKKREKTASDVLLALAQDDDLEGKLTYKRLLSELGHRSFEIAILVFALPSALPLSIVPGFSTLFSLPIAFFSLQLLFGVKSLWIPKFLADKKINHDKLSGFIKKAVPYLKKLERLMKPRLLFLNSTIGETISAIIIFLLAIMLMLPIPFSNFIFALCIVIISLGMLEKDGLVILIGYAIIVIFAAFSYVVLLGAIKAIF